MEIQTLIVGGKIQIENHREKALMLITTTQLKAQLELLLEKLKIENEDIIITDGGKPAFKLCKYKSNPSTEELFAPFRGKVKYYEDLTTPTTDEWSEI
jgi:hypothetical protein